MTSPTHRFFRFAPALLLAFGAIAGLSPVHAQSSAKTVVVDTPSDAWQQHRRQTLDWVRTFNNEKLPKAQREAAYRKFDGLLTQFDKGFFTVTPMEAMDLMQIFYVPNEPDQMETHLTLIAAIATAGWYDALRFADESGRAEIINNEEFFKRALMVRKDAFIQFLTEQPQVAAEAVAKGINFARVAQKNGALKYDIRWPASYGLLRMQCGLSGGQSCKKPAEMPVMNWPTAFDEAAAKVTHYYRINKD